MSVSSHSHGSHTHGKAAPAEAHGHTHGHACQHSHEHHGASPASAEDGLGAGVRTAIHIEQMDCPTEETLIRARLHRMAGVSGMSFNLMQRVLTVSHEPDVLPGVLAAIENLGYSPSVSGARPQAAAAKPWWPLVLGVVAAMVAEAFEWLALGPFWLPALFAVMAVAVSGLDVYRKGWVALGQRQLNINALMSIAVTGALLLGHWPEAAMVMVLFAIAERIEAATLDKARRAVRGLLEMAPEQAVVEQEDGSWRAVPVAEVGLDARVRLRPGERVALDGAIVMGHSAVDQAAITGESVPVEKGPDDVLFAGTVNHHGELVYRVTALASDSTLARIVQAVESAQGSRAPTQRFIDRFASYYTPAIIILALLVAVLPPLLWAVPWLDAAYKALVLLVIACPCALVISTPVSIVSGLTAAARHGILVKGGVHLEQGRHLRILALDKTGTITRGEPALTDFQPLDASIAPADLNRLRAWAGSLAARSDHPVSRAVAEATSDATLIPVSGFTALPGRGVEGVMEDEPFYLGNHRLIHEMGLCSDEIEARLEALEQQGKTTVILAQAARVLAIAGVADTLRESSREAVAELHELGIQTLMLSGDNSHTVAAIAAQAGIDRAHGDLLPEDKMALVAGLAAQERGVGMVGDGVNDAPALARADIGFAMGAAGSDIAIETADVALMDDDLRKVARFVRIARATTRVLKQNIALALGVKGVFLVLTLVGLGTMWMAVFADVGASLLVVFNGLRLLRR